MNEPEIAETDEGLTPAAAAVRAKALDGLAPFKDFAQGLGKCERQAQNWAAEGLPVVRIGRTRYVPIDAGLRWVFSRNTTP
jgi:hypothetical protein